MDPDRAAEAPARPRAIAVLITHDDRILLVRRAASSHLPGYWTPVTGRVEPDETLEAAAQREVREEVGLTIALGTVFHEGTTSDGRFDMTYFDATLIGGTLRLQIEEVSDARWLTRAEVTELTPMLDRTRAAIALSRISPST